jgi:ParB-like chromosome segregation protein Spo0J
MLSWSLKSIKIKDLKEYAHNPRTLSKYQAQQLEESLDKFGLVEKPIVNLDNTIIGGHQRVRLLKKQKHKEVECWIPDRILTERELSEFCIRLNRNQGAWDDEKLANEFELSDLIDWGFTTTDLDFVADVMIEQEKEDKPKKVKTCPNCGETL